MSMETVGTPNPEEETDNQEETELSPELKKEIEEMVNDPEVPEIGEGLKEFARDEAEMLDGVLENVDEEKETTPGLIEKLAHKHPDAAKALRVFMLGTIFAGGVTTLMKPEDAAAQQMRYGRPAATLTIEQGEDAYLDRVEFMTQRAEERIAANEVRRLEMRDRNRELTNARKVYWRRMRPVQQAIAQNRRIRFENARRAANNAYHRETDPVFRKVDDSINWLYEDVLGGAIDNTIGRAGQKARGK